MTICSTVLSCCRLRSPGEVLLTILSRKKTKHCFRQGVYVWSNSQKRRLATSMIRTLRKQLIKCNKFMVKITATQESFQRGKRGIDLWSFILAQAPRILWKRRFMKICFVHVVDFFSHKEAYNSIAVRIFYYHFLRTFDFRMITLRKIS